MSLNTADTTAPLDARSKTQLVDGKTVGTLPPMTLDQPHSSPDDVDLDDDRDKFYTPTNHETIKNAKISQNNSPLLEVSTEMQTR
jgi:hypothetical protein